MKETRLAIGLVFILTLLVACSPAAKPVSPPARSSQPSPSPTAIATATQVAATPTLIPLSPAVIGPTTSPLTSQTPVPTADSRASLSPEAILTKAAAGRGLEPKGEVPFSTLSRAELRLYLIKMFEIENGKEDLEKAKALWVMLDLLEEKDDLYDLWLGLLSEQVAGFYELDSRSMTLVGGGGAISPQDEVILAHEYVHALQDQHFGIGARVKQVKNDGEKSLALKALIEGDATLAMGEYALKNLSREDIASIQNNAGSLNAQKLRSAPPVLQVTLAFPYQMGAIFVGNIFRSGGWTAVNKAYANPPTTSEQIIHPEKYLAGEGAKRVDLPDIASAIGGGWSKLHADTVGELGWLVYLANGLDSPSAVKGAAGWGGDQFVLFRDGTGKQALAMLSVWDSGEDAEEFFYSVWDLQDAQAMTRYTLEEETRFAWTRFSRFGYGSQKGQQVLLVIADDEATTKKIASLFPGF